MVMVRENLNQSYPAVPGSVPRARHELEEFARAAGVHGDRLDSLRLAVSEAASNVVVHAYPDGEGTMQVNAQLVSEQLWIRVSDRGCGHQTQAQRPGLGFGLGLMAAACDDFTICGRAKGGTEARMRFELAGHG